MYGPFLDKQEKNNVSVGMWEAGEYTGEWCSEKYTHKRIVTFDFLKQTIGKTLVKVKHTQQSRRLDKDQCIVQIKMEMAGFPYADCFVVEVRHVASRVGDNDISIQIGMIVRFLKSCMLEKKIKVSTSFPFFFMPFILYTKFIRGFLILDKHWSRNNKGLSLVAHIDSCQGYACKSQRGENSTVALCPNLQITIFRISQ